MTKLDKIEAALNASINDPNFPVPFKLPRVFEAVVCGEAPESALAALDVAVAELLRRKPGMKVAEEKTKTIDRAYPRWPVDQPADISHGMIRMVLLEAA